MVPCLAHTTLLVWSGCGEENTCVEKQFRREHRKLVLFRQMFPVRYDILDWLISGMPGHERVCAVSMPTAPKKVNKRFANTVCQRRLQV
jgi:hypothetical protein